MNGLTHTHPSIIVIKKIGIHLAYCKKMASTVTDLVTLIGGRKQDATTYVRTDSVHLIDGR